MSYYKQQLLDWVASLDIQADTVLDIGGAQWPIKGHTKTWDVKEYKIVDLKIPHSNSPKPDIVQDMNEVLTPQMMEYEQKTDCLVVLGVSDYVINPNIFMDNIARLLKSDGKAYVDFPFVYPTHNPIEDEGCRYSEGCIRRLVKQANLTLSEIHYRRPKPNNPFLTQFYAYDGMRAAKGVDHNVTGYNCVITR